MRDQDIPLLRENERIFSIQRDNQVLKAEEMQDEIQRLLSDFNMVFSGNTGRIKGYEHVIK